ncbi:hypothetical protein ACJX0J_013305, partial [Zea mays]
IIVTLHHYGNYLFGQDDIHDDNPEFAAKAFAIYISEKMDLIREVTNNQKKGKRMANVLKVTELAKFSEKRKKMILEEKLDEVSKHFENSAFLLPSTAAKNEEHR